VSNDEVAKRGMVGRVADQSSRHTQPGRLTPALDPMARRRSCRGLR
jgi:hypothetical protein